MSKQKYLNATAYSSACVGIVNTGTTYYNKPIDNTILPLFDTSFQSALQSITTLQAAKNFVDLYGTHVALGWNLGGSSSISIKAATSSYQDKLAIAATVNGKYSSVNTVNASASAAYQLNTNGSQHGLDQNSTIVGGSAAAARQIDIKSPNTNIDAWVASCNANTTYGLSTSISMVDLANKTGNPAAGGLLQQYIHLVLLSYSLENPTTFTNQIQLQQNTTVEVTTTASKDYKIVSGGADISSMNTANSYLTGCCPQTQAAPGGGLEITGWIATSHDCCSPASTSNFLTVHAIAVYDPGNYLSVFVSGVGGTNPGSGGDTANSPDWPNVHTAILTGGGCQTSIPDGGFPKYMTSNGPRQINGEWKSWNASVQDYLDPATTVNLIGYAIGIGSIYLSINSTVISSPTSQAQEQGNQQTQLGNGLNLIGGGVTLGAPTQGNGNLVRQSYPLDKNTWAEYNTDLDGSNSPCIATGYAIGVTASINGVS